MLFAGAGYNRMVDNVGGVFNLQLGGAYALSVIGVVFIGCTAALLFRANMTAMRASLEEGGAQAPVAVVVNPVAQAITGISQSYPGQTAP